MARTGTATAKRGQPRGRARRRQNNARLLWFGLAALLLFLGILLANGIANGAFVTVQAQEFPIQSRDHIDEGASHPPYNSDPPTGGWHYAQPAPPGVYDKPLADERLVHNLEHGHVVIYYDCSKLPDCDAVKAQLKSIFDKNNGWKMVVAPRQNRDPGAAIALTAWGRLLDLGQFDQARIQAFIRQYRDKGPEQTAE